MALDIVLAAGPLLDEWRSIHNAIIPTAPLSADEVADRSGRHRLTLARADGHLVGNATVRPPLEPGDTVATVIVRILPEHRRAGHGTEYLAAELEQAYATGARRIETIVLASNSDGLAFARARGFVEHDRYLLDGDTVPFVDLHLPGPRRDETPQPGRTPGTLTGAAGTAGAPGAGGRTAASSWALE